MQEIKSTLKNKYTQVLYTQYTVILIQEHMYSVFSQVIKFEHISLLITTIVFHALDATIYNIAGTRYCTWMETYQVLHLFKHFNDLGVLYFVMGKVKDADRVQFGQVFQRLDIRQTVVGEIQGIQGWHAIYITDVNKFINKLTGTYFIEHVHLCTKFR